MNELRPHGRELLDAARRERTPSATDHARLLQELLLAAQATDASTEPAQRLSLASKLLLLAALAVLIGFALYFVGRAG
jgi:hypothetical protein